MHAREPTSSSSREEMAGTDDRRDSSASLKDKTCTMHVTPALCGGFDPQA
jgi:hypothetical protein